MKLEKYICEIAKRMLKSDNKKPVFFDFNGRIAATTDGIMAMIITKDQMIFDAPIKSTMPCGKDYTSYTPTAPTGISRKSKKIKGEAVEFDCGYSLNSKYMAYFSEKAKYTTNNKGTFIVYENSIPVGIIMGIDNERLSKDE